MAKDPDEPVQEKVGSYDKETPDAPPERTGSGGGPGALVTVILIALALLLVLWLFTDII